MGSQRQNHPEQHPAPPFQQHGPDLRDQRESFSRREDAFVKHVLCFLYGRFLPSWLADLPEYFVITLSSGKDGIICLDIILGDRRDREESQPHHHKHELAGPWRLLLRGHQQRWDGGEERDSDQQPGGAAP